MSKWVVERCGQGSTLHALPVNDTRHHETDASRCWCNPTIDTDDDLIVIHRALDRRELFERRIEAACRALCKIDNLDPDEDWRQIPGGVRLDVIAKPDGKRWRKYRSKAMAVLECV
jgi:hypothetical protein